MPGGYRMVAKSDLNAEIYIYESIGAYGLFDDDGLTAKSFAKDLKALGKPQVIDLRINSDGGDVFDGMAIYRQLVDHHARIVSHVDGIAASAASVIAMAGDEIRISESGFLMIHNASGLAIGGAAEMRSMAERLEVVNAAIVDVYAARTGNSVTDLKAWMDAETWMDGNEAVKRRFADGVMSNQRVAASVDSRRWHYRNTPAELERRSDDKALRDKIAGMRLQMSQHRQAAAGDARGGFRQIARHAAAMATKP